MGMTAKCAGCGHEENSDNRRGGRLGRCPECGGQMRAHTAGKAKGRYHCPVTGWVVTLGMSYSVQLEQPMRLIFIPGWDNYSGERRHRAEPDRYELAYLERAGGLVLGPGCVVERDFAPPGPGDHHYGHAGVYLVPAPDAEPATWFVNEKLTYRKCAACPKKVVASEATCMPGPWTPRRASYWGRRQDVPTSPGPHPAGTYACRDCDPRRRDPGLL
jgi:hypothetical protein